MGSLLVAAGRDPVGILHVGGFGHGLQGESAGPRGLQLLLGPGGRRGGVPGVRVRRGLVGVVPADMADDLAISDPQLSRIISALGIIRKFAEISSPPLPNAGPTQSFLLTTSIWSVSPKPSQWSSYLPSTGQYGTYAQAFSFP